MADNYSFRAIDPRTQANLHAAILTVGKLLNLGELPDSIVDHLMDRVKDTLSPGQRFDPLSAYSPDVLGLVTSFVKDTYGLDRPVNIHAAPQARGDRDDAKADSGGFFDRDAFGLIGIQRRAGGVSNEEHSARSGSAVSFGESRFGSSMSYRQMQSIGYAEIMAMSHAEFQRTEFARYGLDLRTTQELFAQGFNTTQIVNAAQDIRALGLDPTNKDLAAGFAVQERFDPKGRSQRQTANKAYGEWLDENKDEIKRLQSAVDCTVPGTPAYEAAKGELDALWQQGYVETGQKAVDEHLMTVEPAPTAQPGDREKAIGAQEGTRQAIETQKGVNRGLAPDSDLDAALGGQPSDDPSPPPSAPIVVQGDRGSVAAFAVGFAPPPEQADAAPGAGPPAVPSGDTPGAGPPAAQPSGGSEIAAPASAAPTGGEQAEGAPATAPEPKRTAVPLPPPPPPNPMRG